MSDGEIQLNDPQALYRNWEQSQWNPFEVDLGADREQWAALAAADRDLVYWVLASLMVAEERITTKFSGLVGAYGTEEEAAFLATQQVDEARHMQFYARFQDELLVWRELAHNFCHHDPGHRTLDAVPAWARKELDDHADDPRPALYSMEELERGETESALWNAAQRCYVRDGTMPNYLRMLWGKAILHWSADAATALGTMEQLNNKYSLDGRDPNSYAGFHWILGKFDRPFFRRPVFGTVRYMSLTAAEKKFDVRGWLESEAAKDEAAAAAAGRAGGEG